jgi:hypothetical protein
MKDLGLVHHFLGIKIPQTSSGLHLSQSHYALTILEWAAMVACKPMSTPLEAKTKSSSHVIPLKVLKLKLNPEGQGRQPPTDQPQQPATSRSRQPPPRLQPPTAFTLEG